MIPVVYAEGEYYHIFNRGVARQPIFKTRRDYLRAITAIDFYRFLTPPLRLSKALLLEKEIILTLFKNSKAYREFVHDQVEYAKELEKIKHLTFE